MTAPRLLLSSAVHALPDAAVSELGGVFEIDLIGLREVRHYTAPNFEGALA
jgi:hypothetical protein